MLKVVIYRDIQRINCSNEHFVQYSLSSMIDLNAMHRKDAWKYMCMEVYMHVIFAMFPIK